MLFKTVHNCLRCGCPRNQAALTQVWGEVKRLKALRKQTELPQDTKIEKTKKYLVRLWQCTIL